MIRIIAKGTRADVRKLARKPGVKGLGTKDEWQRIFSGLMRSWQPVHIILIIGMQFQNGLLILIPVIKLHFHPEHACTIGLSNIDDKQGYQL